MAVAAYASLLCIIQVVDRVRQLHAQGEIHLDSTQIEILRERFVFLMCFLEKTNSLKLSTEIQALTGQISLLAVEAELIFDEEFGNQFSGVGSGEVSSSASALDYVIRKLGFIYEGLDRIVIEAIDCVDITPVGYSDEVIEKKLVGSSDSDSLAAATSSSKFELVGFEDRVSWVIDKLTDDETSLQAIPIVGMGGIGKTTLAQSVYDHPNIQRRFDRRMWCTISQNFDVKQILWTLLEGDKSNQEISELGDRLHKKLHGRRFLIVMDDMWDGEAWECLMIHLPDNHNGSRVIITTRNSTVPSYLGSDGKHCALALLDRNKSWDLLRRKIFGENGCCPDELKEIGMNIAKSCNGLPLSLVTIGGLLSKSDMTQTYWKYVAANVRRLVSSTEGNHCLKVLSLSYHCMPIHLKPCFLYLRNFKEDEKIFVDELIRRWIAEGYFNPVANETIEDIAEEYLKDLIERNLVLILRRSELTGNIQECGVHDLIRDLCIEESSKENFVSTPRFKRCRDDNENYTCLICNRLLKSVPVPVCEECKIKHPLIERSRLVNFFDLKCHATLRAIDCRVRIPDDLPPRTVLNFWNLQFLSLQIRPYDARKVDPKCLSAIWELPQLRFLDLPCISLPDPSTSTSTVMSELQKLNIWGLRLNDELIHRIPNLKRLKLVIHHNSDFSLHLLECFQRLRSFTLYCYDLAKYKIKFPWCLMKLNLSTMDIDWDKMMILISSLPNLQVLKLEYVSVEEWNMEEEVFASLKALMIRHTGIRVWGVESRHFPVLESLVIEDEREFEIPADLGNIDTLNSIRVDDCSDRTFES